MSNQVVLIYNLNNINNGDDDDNNNNILNEPRREKTGFWPMRKQRRRSASK